MHILSPVTDNCSSWISRRDRNGRRNFFMTKSPWKNVPDMVVELGAACMPSGLLVKSKCGTLKTASKLCFKTTSWIREAFEICISKFSSMSTYESRKTQMIIYWNLKKYENCWPPQFEPHHEKTFLCHMWTTKPQISLRICAVWPVPLLFTAWIV